MKQFFLSAGLAASLLAVQAFAETEYSKHISDPGYSVMDGGRYINTTEEDGIASEVVFSNPNVITPCNGKNLPPTKTRDAIVENSLSCSGSTSIDQMRVPEAFDRMPGFKEILSSGDQSALYSFMRQNSKTSWDYNLEFDTTVHWTWNKIQEGKIASECGYDYHATTCTETTEVESRECHLEADEDDSSSGSSSGISGGHNSPRGGGSRGGGGGHHAPSGGGGSGNKYEHSNPVGFNGKTIEHIFALVLPQAHAKTVCSFWSHDHYTTRSFTCYNRTVKFCPFQHKVSESFKCSDESMPVHVELQKKEESVWNPSLPNYVPFLPNGNDLLPGEVERLRMDIRISGRDLDHTAPVIAGGATGHLPSYYHYENSVTNAPFQCAQNKHNSLNWQITSKDRQVSKTPNSLVFQAIDKNETEDPNFNQTGLFDQAGNSVLSQGPNGLIATALPEVLKVLDTSSSQLNAITASFRQADGRGETSDNDEGALVRRGTVTAGRSHQFWKDTFYRIQLLEVFPDAWFSKKPKRVAEIFVQSDSLVRRQHNLLTFPLAGQRSDTPSVYYQTSSGVVIPEGYFKAHKIEYILIPGQAYEMRLSMLHRGIPFYQSGCSDGGASCERETPNPEAFSDIKKINFVYNGVETRGIWRQFYDWQRRFR